MAVQYEKKPSADPKDLDPSVEAASKFDSSTIVKDIKSVAESTAKISYPLDAGDLTKDPVFLAILTGAVTKHGVEHYSLANESSVKGRVQALMTATEKIKGVLQNHA